MPMITDARGQRVEKYRTEMATASIQWQVMAYGGQPVFLMAAEVDATQHTLISGFSDVSSFPQNLDATLGANRQTVEDSLESHNLPGNWVTTGMTYRFVLRVIVGVILLAQRFRGLDTGAGGPGSLFPSGVTLATTFNAMPVDFRTRLQDAAVSLGYNISALTGTDTMRTMLKAIGEQATPITFLGTVL
jgi:hypothetical protein